MKSNIRSFLMQILGVKKKVGIDLNQCEKNLMGDKVAWLDVHQLVGGGKGEERSRLKEGREEVAVFMFYNPVFNKRSTMLGHFMKKVDDAKIEGVNRWLICFF